MHMNHSGNDRITVTMTPKAQTAIDTLLLLGVAGTKSDIVNRAVQLYGFLEEQRAAGRTVALIDGDKTAELHFF